MKTIFKGTLALTLLASSMLSICSGNKSAGHCLHSHLPVRGAVSWKAIPYSATWLREVAAIYS